MQRGSYGLFCATDNLIILNSVASILLGIIFWILFVSKKNWLWNWMADNIVQIKKKMMNGHDG